MTNMDVFLWEGNPYPDPVQIPTTFTGVTYTSGREKPYAYWEKGKIVYYSRVSPNRSDDES